ncbi:MAG: DUF4351 domain-containing protein [Timaviella obliquedivisa GSE-PSE-MK23-08B]|jgi:predicted transposase YdaD|nr:DUF4351 domain-containing protein [Timaviella obliquedivisa GSE-PSE-MK23-08B]
MPDHDHAFKELLGEFFPEFIDLFFPQVAVYLDRHSLEFQPQEIFADLTEGDTYEADVVVKARFLNEDSFFIVHLEHQGVFGKNFDRRMFNYFSQLHRIYQLPVYPIVIFSHRSPREEGDRTYKVKFSDWEVLQFNYRAIRLNHLNWQAYAQLQNPVASAFMAKMKMERQERPLVKLECLKQMARLRLNPAQAKMISGFVDTYLRLEQQEEEVFQTELDKIDPSQKEVVMEVVTSWMEAGIERGERSLILRQLNRRVGSLPQAMQAQVEALPLERLDALGEALLDFVSLADLETWLAQ